jgi:hypothetical protein
MLAPVSLTSGLLPLVKNTVDYSFAGVRGLGSSFFPNWSTRRGNALEIGELYTKFYEGKALSQWADKMNRQKPGSFDSNMLTELNTSIKRTESLLNQANYSRWWGIDYLFRGRLPLVSRMPETRVVLQSRVRARLDRFLENEMLHAMNTN